MDEVEVIALFAPEGDAEGMLAYALHRRALLAFRAEFAVRQARPAQAGEETAFMMGETAPERIAAYRAQARMLIEPSAIGATSATPARTKPQKRGRWPFMGQWIEDPAGTLAQPLNWRGLLARLFVLLLAVVTTALLLRVLVVKN